MSSISTILRVQRAYACTAETIYDAWLDPDVARHFLFATPPTGEVTTCEIDPGVNGHFVVVDHRPVDGDSAMDMRHEGRYLQLDRPRRIAFTFWLPQFGGHETTVILDIEPQGDGCELTLRHDLGPWFKDPEVRQRTEDGWSKMLANLEAALAKA
ncbi:SRPBCC family protein [Ramlibacter algicola]|uniref:SRPBCC domain-containing protein n=1 Tax=Ramlibacter algicola TaxID=2795217 RepID=A0A934PYB8_9BURK|nr:SRPBCC domain-containing protein [Ramlibacter algicola]MBK0391368.1 SRPBCC domain-containing protein [Ramlibacter algicola]